MGGYGEAIVLIAATVASTAVTVSSQRDQAKSAAAFAEAEQKRAEEEAAAAELQAQEDLRRQRRINEQLLAAEEADVARSGLVSGVGTPLERLSQNAAILELNALEDFQNKRILSSEKRFRGLIGAQKGKAEASALRKRAIGTGIRGATQTAGIFASQTGGTTA